MNDTTMPTPTAVTRTLTGRLLINLTPLGLLEIKDSTGANVLRSQQLNIGDEVTATYELASVDHCGGLVIQPMDWSAGCRGEISQALGNVDFSYMVGTGYKARPQSQRLKTISVTFKRLTATTGQICSTIGAAGAAYSTACDIALNPESTGAIGATAAFISYSEIRSILDATGAPTSTPMTGGGKVTLSLVDAARNPVEFSIL